MNQSAQKKIILVLLCAAAVFFSLFRLTESPPVWYDEGWYIQTATNIAEQGVSGLQLSPGSIVHVSAQTTVGYPLIAPLAGWLKLWGADIYHARLLMVVFVLVLILLSCLTARSLWGTSIAMSVCALLVTLPTLYGNGKSVLGEVPGLVYLCASLYFFHRSTAAVTHRRAWLVASALAAGLCVATKPLFIVLIPAIAIAVIFELKHKTIHPVDLCYALGAGLVPIALWAYLQFEASNSLSAILAYYANPYGIRNMAEVIASNARHLITDPGTLYLTLSMLLWLGALCIRVRSREKIPGAEVIGFFFSLFVILAFLRTAGWYRYLFPAQVVAILFLPCVLNFLTSRTGNGVLRPVAIWIVALLAVFGAYQCLFNSWVATSYGSHRTAEWQSYMASQPPTDSFFFYNTPEVALFAPGPNYYQYLEPAGITLGGEFLRKISDGAVTHVIVRSDAYATQPGLFSRYEAERTLDKYTILKLSRAR